MMKKISFVKLKQKFNKKSKNKVKQNEDKQTDDTKDDEEYGEPEDNGCHSKQFDVNYDRLSTNSETNLNIDSENNHLIRFPTVLLQSFRNKFKRNKTKQKVNQISEITQIDPESGFQTNETKTQLDLNDESIQINSSEDFAKTESTSKDLTLTTDQTLIDGRNEDTNQRKSVKKFSLVDEIDRIVSKGWYWGPITRKEAEDKLRDQTDGSFLVRDSSDDHYLFSLSFRSFGRTLHTRIEYNGMFSFYSNGSTDGNSSLIDLIQHSMSNSEKGVFCYSKGRSPVSPSFPVRLTRPVSRFSEVRSLQYLCKFVIRQSTSFSQIQNLPLPKSIKGFIENSIID